MKTMKMSWTHVQVSFLCVHAFKSKNATGALTIPATNNLVDNRQTMLHLKEQVLDHGSYCWTYVQMSFIFLHIFNYEHELTRRLKMESNRQVGQNQKLTKTIILYANICFYSNDYNKKDLPKGLCIRRSLSNKRKKAK